MEATQIAPETLTRPTVDIQRLAWLILVSSTILFCSSTIAVSGGIYYFFVRSAIPMDVIVDVSRGTAGMIASDFSERPIRDGLSNLRDRDFALSTDPQSQATIAFPMIGDGDYQPVLASITLKGADMRLIRADRPRYRWSEGLYWIELDDVTGELDIFVSRAADRPFVILIHTITGDTIRIDDPGRYSFTADSSQIRLAAREGEAVWLTSDGVHNRLVTTGQEAIVFIGRGLPFVTSSSQNLLENSFFALQSAPINTDSDIRLPMGWGCTDTQDSLPRGSFNTDLWDGRPALRLVRTDGAQSQGKTGCRQEFGEPGIDVSAYSYLELQTTFLINYQSLSDCGQLGSECPMMLRMIYVDVNGVEREWIQGFFSQHDVQRKYPTACVTCPQIYQPHQFINEKAWYTFETGNLFDLLIPAEHPAHISRFEFYASGHEYDVFVSEVALLGGQVEVIPPNQNIVPINPTPSTGG